MPLVKWKVEQQICVAAMRLNDYQLARTACEKAIALEPLNALARQNLESAPGDACGAAHGPAAERA